MRTGYIYSPRSPNIHSRLIYIFPCRANPRYRSNDQLNPRDSAFCEGDEQRHHEQHRGEELQGGDAGPSPVCHVQRGEERILRLLHRSSERDQGDGGLPVRNSRDGGQVIRASEPQRQLERNDEGTYRETGGYRAGFVVGDSRKGENRRLYGALLRSGGPVHHDAEDQDIHLVVQVPDRAGKRSLVLHPSCLLLHQRSALDLRSLVPVQLSEQQGEVQGRRRKEGIQHEGVLLVLHDFFDTAGWRRGSEEPFRKTGCGYLVVVRVHHYRLLHGEPCGVPDCFQIRDTDRDIGGSQQTV